MILPTKSSSDQTHYSIPSVKCEEFLGGKELGELFVIVVLHIQRPLSTIYRNFSYNNRALSSRMLCD
jgi:hypothetical protein